MNDTEIIKAVAELDGIPIERLDICMCGNSREGYHEHPFTPMLDWSNVPRYLTSRDAIVPVIEKQPFNLQPKIDRAAFELTRRDGYRIFATPRQLCVALLRATGKWKD